MSAKKKPIAKKAAPKRKAAAKPKATKRAARKVAPAPIPAPVETPVYGDARNVTGMDFILGRKLRRARVAAGLSQQGLAEILGITFQQVQKYEKASNRISSARLYAISAAVKQPICFFLQNPPGVPEKPTIDLVEAVA